MLSAVCLLVAGALRANLPASEFTLAWQHSIEKTRWEERYRIEDDRLALIEARIEALGAGMEPPQDARLIHGWWVWRPRLEPMRELRITHSHFTRDYDLCWNGQCARLGALIGDNGDLPEVVTLVPCVAPSR